MTTMTGIVPMPRHELSDVSTRIGGLLKARPSRAQWWVELAEQLDDLAQGLIAESDEVWRGMSDQITRDAPHMTSQLRRIDAEHEVLARELLRVRILAGECAGDAGRVRTVKDAVRSLLHRLRRYESRATQALYDAYERDIGGESA